MYRYYCIVQQKNANHIYERVKISLTRTIYMPMHIYNLKSHALKKKIVIMNKYLIIFMRRDK